MHVPLRGPPLRGECPRAHSWHPKAACHRCSNSSETGLVSASAANGLESPTIKRALSGVRPSLCTRLCPEQHDDCPVMANPSAVFEGPRQSPSLRSAPSPLRVARPPGMKTRWRSKLVTTAWSRNSLCNAFPHSQTCAPSGTVPNLSRSIHTLRRRPCWRGSFAAHASALHRRLCQRGRLSRSRPYMALTPSATIPLQRTVCRTCRNRGNCTSLLWPGASSVVRARGRLGWRSPPRPTPVSRAALLRRLVLIALRLPWLARTGVTTACFLVNNSFSANVSAWRWSLL